MRSWALGLMAAVLACVPLGAAAQSGAEDELVVTGQRVEDAMRAFVGEISAPPQGEDQLARWDRRICPGVIGVSSRQGQVLVDRLALRAFSVDLDVGEPGCRPNVLIFVTPDSNRLARELVDDYPDLVGYDGGQAAQTQGRDALESFATLQRPVRWWHVAQTVTRDGQVLGNAETRPQATGGFRGAQVVRNAPPSRLQRATRQDFANVLIIVDAREAAGVPIETLGDYLAMVSLAQLDADAETADYPSILNLFSARAMQASAPSVMTDWDVAYLQGLYGAQRNAATSRQQEAEIGRRMRDGVTE